MFLPLAHSLARIIQMVTIDVGGTLAFWQRRVYCSGGGPVVGLQQPTQAFHIEDLTGIACRDCSWQVQPSSYDPRQIHRRQR
jgi:hypothetical protein